MKTSNKTKTIRVHFRAENIKKQLFGDNNNTAFGQ